ncbi:TAP-like protein-domain-containing protein [Hypoxylon fuscum]|nr:TAP-like protein-domain-containing protein [Hypoxylon fuscum]
MKFPVQVGLFLAALGRHVTAQSASDFDWDTIRPSTSLNYTTCYDIHKCAKLSVPLDWLNPTNTTSRVTLAIIARPAVVPESDPSFGGTIITNPGGPGGSGVSFLLTAGAALQAMADGSKHYEILSFDPRGIGFTEPKADCFDDEFARAVTTLELRAMGPLDGGIDVVRRQTALFGAYGRLCEGGPSIHAYMSTASVARDMVEIVDKIDEARNKNATTTTTVRMRGGPRHLQQRQDDSALPRIQYWGFSYGTVIGNYFASMFPGRVGRMILEAVVDVHDYHAVAWVKNLQDTQKDYDTFYTSCFEFRGNCALYQPNDTSGAAIRQRVEAFLGQLRESPAQVVSGSRIESITANDVLGIIFSGLYQPLQTFPLIAAGLAQAMAGNFSAVYASLGLPGSSAAYCPNPLPRAYTWSQDVLLAVACGDGVPQTHSTTADFLAYLAELKMQAPDFAASWAQIRIVCAGWRVRPKYTFAGPWTTLAADPSGADNTRPAAPLLFISSQYDPVTPHANAVAMAAEHEGSAVLVQNGPGHGTIETPGACRDGHIKTYFETGALPADGTVCEPDCKPFQDCPQLQVAKRALDDAVKR